MAYIWFTTSALARTSATTDNEDADFPIENATGAVGVPDDYGHTTFHYAHKRPFYTYRTADKTLTTITINPAGNYNTVHMFNCNFPAATIKLGVASYPVTAVYDKDTGLYNFGYYWVSAQSSNVVIEIASSQTTYNGAMYYEIGSIVIGPAVYFYDGTTYPLPQLPIKKRVIGTYETLEYDSGGHETSLLGRPYRTFEFVWNATNRAALENLQNLVRLASPDGTCVVHEYWDDYTAMYLCSPYDTFDHQQKAHYYKISLKLRELI